ncbi:hypothetical protein A0128_19760 [Leptospira tipperaryensis]|uniref:histidine kinase n=1 Tax=Leptospira tipperaryensis TaxID=2564040 RepID=A0A1D7V352_9LEPT|nr:response regulator [Leptospira tipperaryensis]AOP36265.1 hypothetical protein A0128_19760 [Leptospira tipperaryensis]
MKLNFIENILIVDDILSNLKLLRVYLEAEGYNVFQALDGAEGLRILDERKIDAIVSDILMPNMDGYEFCSKIRTHENYNSIVFIFYTATYTSASEEQFAMKLGADAFFRKPSDLSKLIRTIQSISQNFEERSPPALTQSTESILREYSHSLVAKLEEQNAKLTEQNDLLIHEVAERKKAEEESKRQSTYFRLLFELSPIGIVMLDKDNLVLATNQMFLEIFQFSANELIGNNLDDFIIPPNKITESETLLKAAALGVTDPTTIVRKKKDESLVDIQLQMYPFVMDGEVIAICGIYLDQTKQRSLEKQLRQSQKLESLGTLASSIAHDFNNILSIIMGHANLMELRKSDESKLVNSINVIKNATDRGASIVKQLLTFARKADTSYKSILINDVVNEIGSFLHDTLPKTIILKISLTSNIPIISADASQVHQLLLNLCINARDSMTEQGVLTISTQEVEKEIVEQKFPKASAKSYIRVRVSDTGTGMTEETMQKVFEPFFTTKESGKGTGLGLSVVYGIVKNHYGFIDIRSKVGIGTTFTIYFPVQEFRSIQKEDLKDQIGDFRTKRIGSILLVEDEEFIREFSEEFLSGFGYEVITAENGKDGLEKFEKHQNELSLVISDLDIPKISGKDLCLKILTLKPEMKILITSGYIEKEVKKTLQNKQKGTIFIQKPYLPFELLNAINELFQ